LTDTGNMTISSQAIHRQLTNLHSHILNLKVRIERTSGLQHYKANHLCWCT